MVFISSHYLKKYGRPYMLIADMNVVETGYFLRVGLYSHVIAVSNLIQVVVNELAHSIA